MGGCAWCSWHETGNIGVEHAAPDALRCALAVATALPLACLLPTEVVHLHCACGAVLLHSSVSPMATGAVKCIRPHCVIQKHATLQILPRNDLHSMLNMVDCVPFMLCRAAS